MSEEQTEPEEHEGDPAKELDSVLGGVEDKGLKLVKVGRQYVKAGQDMADVAGATRKLVQIVKAPPNVEHLLSDWEEASVKAGSLLAHLESGDVTSVWSASGTAAYTSSDTASYSEQYFRLVPEGQHPELVSAITDLNSVLERSADEEEVVRLMTSLGLDAAPAGEKSAVELFRTAHAAYAAPVTDTDPIATSLLPARESIRQVILGLLRRRPKTEETKKEWDKIISIGMQLKYDSIPRTQVSAWAYQWTSRLRYDLSPSKKEDITRDEWRIRLVRATLFLKGFLSGIDPSKLR
jgi:hypothetical protein